MENIDRMLITKEIASIIGDALKEAITKANTTTIRIEFVDSVNKPVKEKVAKNQNVKPVKAQPVKTPVVEATVKEDKLHKNVGKGKHKFSIAGVVAAVPKRLSSAKDVCRSLGVPATTNNKSRVGSILYLAHKRGLVDKVPGVSLFWPKGMKLDVASKNK